MKLGEIKIDKKPGADAPHTGARLETAPAAISVLPFD